MRKKLITIILTLVLVLSMALPALAADLAPIENALRNLVAQRPGAAPIVEDTLAWLNENPDRVEGSEAAIAAQINAAANVAPGIPAADLTLEQLTDISNRINAGASLANLTVSFNLDTMQDIVADIDAGTLAPDALVEAFVIIDNETGETIFSWFPDTDFTTIHNGINYALVYHFEFYMEQNPDLAAVFGNNANAAIAHFVNHGMREGRIAHPGFNVNHYRNANSDLRAVFGNDLRAFFTHFMRFGHRENRPFSPVLTDPITVRNGTDFSRVYNMNTYLDLNPDVRDVLGNDEVAVLAHFVNHGMREGRIAHTGFNVHEYRNANPDLRAVFGNDLRAFFTHFMRFGHAENRPTSPELINPITDPTDGIDYSRVYNMYTYLELNPDVRDVLGYDEVAVLAHFINHGMREGRIAHTYFDVHAYRELNPDLEPVFGNNLRAYFMHFINHGYNEGRPATH